MHHRNALRLRCLGIDTYQHHVVFLRADCHVSVSEGFVSQSRVRVSGNGRTILATVNVVKSDLLADGEASLSEAARLALGVGEHDVILLSHPAPVESLSLMRSKVYGNRLDDKAMEEIVKDIVLGRYSELHLAAFVTACAGSRLDEAEMIALTRAMIKVGQRIEWRSHNGNRIVVDKHCVGGLPGNRTTPIVVAIVAAHGLLIPKTSSRAITSPAGTADTMEMLAPVELGIDDMRRVVEKEGGCIVWGGSAGLSPADDMLIRVERPLELDSEGQLIASVLSKKAAAGSTHVVVDIPLGPTAKVRTPEAAEVLRQRLQLVGHAVGLEVRAIISDGSQPVGRGIGPALEAYDVLAVLQGKPDAPADLRERSLTLASLIIEMAGSVPRNMGRQQAEVLLENGAAWIKFQAICEAQGGMRIPPKSGHHRPVLARHKGRVTAIDNRRLARVAKLAGAPKAVAAGVEFLAPIGTEVVKGQPLYVVHAEAQGELNYALDYVSTQDSNIITVE